MPEMSDCSGRYRRIRGEVKRRTFLSFDHVKNQSQGYQADYGEMQTFGIDVLWLQHTGERRSDDLSTKCYPLVLDT